MPEHPSTKVNGLSFTAALYSHAVGKYNDVVYTGTPMIMTYDIMTNHNIPPAHIVAKYFAYEQRMIVLSATEINEMIDVDRLANERGVRVLKGLAYQLTEKPFQFDNKLNSSSYNIIMMCVLSYAWQLMSLKDTRVHEHEAM